MSQSVSNFTEVMNLLKKSAEENTYEIWIPSLQKNAKFKYFTTSHHKKFVKILMDADMFTCRLNLHIYDVIKQTCIEPDVNVDDLNLFDKLAICYAMRYNNFNKKIISVTNGEIQHDVLLTDLIDKCRVEYKNIEPEVFDDSNVKIKLSIPTLKREKEFDTYITQKHLGAGYNRSNTDQLNQILADLVLYGVAQYIETITINNAVLAFATLNTEQKIEIVSNLNKMTFTRLSEFIQKYNDQRARMSAASFTTEGKTEDLGIELDASFFVEE